MLSCVGKYRSLLTSLDLLYFHFLIGGLDRYGTACFKQHWAPLTKRRVVSVSVWPEQTSLTWRHIYLAKACEPTFGFRFAAPRSVSPHSKEHTFPWNQPPIAVPTYQNVQGSQPPRIMISKTPARLTRSSRQCTHRPAGQPPVQDCRPTIVDAERRCRRRCRRRRLRRRRRSADADRWGGAGLSHRSIRPLQRPSPPTAEGCASGR